ncbi:MAG TPA: hypothetical protein VGP02_19625 [Mycobacteriales bacterium]|nr:hypothetical protein [Mycobacteriales bacterium]
MSYVDERDGEPATVDETVPVEFDGYATFDGEYGGGGLTGKWPSVLPRPAGGTLGA